LLIGLAADFDAACGEARFSFDREKILVRAIDAGTHIPNDDFIGKAPDLGALETGRPEPHYGPRWLTWQPFYR
jgi:hypothetical protein